MHCISMFLEKKLKKEKQFCTYHIREYSQFHYRVSPQHGSPLPVTTSIIIKSKYIKIIKKKQHPATTKNTALSELLQNLIGHCRYGRQ